MDQARSKQTKEFWLEHLRRLGEFGGTQGKYAELNGLSKSKLSYYKTKFAPKTSFAKVVAKKPTAVEKPVIASPRVDKSAIVQKLPDAKWLAALIRELSR